MISAGYVEVACDTYAVQSSAMQLTDLASLTSWCASAQPEWQLSRMTAITVPPPSRVQLDLTWHDGSGWGGEARNVDGVRVVIDGVTSYRLDGAHDPGTTLGYIMPADCDDELGLLLAVPGELEVIGTAITVEKLPTLRQVAPYKLNPRRVTFELAALPTVGEWRGLVGDIDVWIDGEHCVDLAARPALGNAWAVYPPTCEHGSEAGAWLQWLRPAHGAHALTLVNLIRQASCGDALWHSLLAAVATSTPASISCGNVRFTLEQWRHYLADGALPVVTTE